MLKIMPLLLLLAACSAGSAIKTPPLNRVELVENFLTALEQDRLFDEAFYGDGALEGFTGGSAVRSSVVTETPARMLQTEIARSPASYITLRRKLADGHIVEISGELGFSGSGGSLRDVLGHLGSSCHEDAEAEWASFNAAAKAPLGPQTKPFSIVVCDLAPSKSGHKKRFLLYFGMKDELDRVHFDAS